MDASKMNDGRVRRDICCTNLTLYTSNTVCSSLRGSATIQVGAGRHAVTVSNLMLRTSSKVVFLAVRKITRNEEIEERESGEQGADW